MDAHPASSRLPQLENLPARLKELARQTGRLGVVIYNEINRTRLAVVGAAVAFFMLLSLVPLLMVFSAFLSVLPIPNLFQQMLDILAMVTPPGSMVYIRGLLQSIQTPYAGRILSIGILSYLWAASGCFSALIDALNIAYDAPCSRAWWRDKLQALLLTFTCGALTICSLLALVAGPHFGHFLTYIFPLPHHVAVVWPVLRLSIILVTGVLGVELLYYLGPNVRTTLWSTLPGAAFAIGVWITGSLVLSYYLQHLTNYSATYGSLGAIIGLMLWLYLSAFTILAGAELNAELIKRHNKAKTANGNCLPAAADVAVSGTSTSPVSPASPVPRMPAA